MVFSMSATTEVWVKWEKKALFKHVDSPPHQIAVKAIKTNYNVAAIITRSEDITLTLEQVKLKNMRVWEYLGQFCELIGSPLTALVQRELMAAKQNENLRTATMRVLKKSGQVQSYKSNQSERQYFNVLAGNGAELLHIRVYQLHRFTMVRQGLTYKFSNMVKKGDACWVVGTSTIGYAPPVPVDTWPDHKLVLPEEEPATGCKRSLQNALGSPQKSTVQGKIIQVAPIVYRRDGTLVVRSLALKDKSSSPVKVTLFEDCAQADYIEDSVLEVTGVYNRTFQNKKQLAASSVTTCQYVVESPEDAIIISDEDRSFFNDDADFNPQMEAPEVTAMIEQIFDVAVYSGCSNEACRKKKMNNGICPVYNGSISSKTVRLSVEITMDTTCLKQTLTIFEKDVRNIFQLDLAQEEDDLVLMLVEQLPVNVKGTIARNVFVNVHKV